MKKNRILNFIAFTLCLPILLCSQTRNLHIEGSGEQLGVIQTTSTGPSISGMEFLRGNEFSATDWKIINDGGVFKIVDGTDNFLTAGTENLRLSNNGILTLPAGIEASLGDASGVLVIGDPNGQNLGIDQNEILARNGTGNDDLYLQAGAGVGNTFLNIADGNVGIGGNIAPVKLTINDGTDATASAGGYLLMGFESGQNVVIDNNEIISRNGNTPGTLLLQLTGGEVSIGMPSASVEANLAIEDSGNQIHISNSDQVTNDWFIGASNPNWVIGGGKMIIGTGGSSNQNMMSFDRTSDLVEIQRSNGDVLLCSQENGQVGIGITDINNLPDAQYLLAVDGRMLAEEVRVEISSLWPDYVFHDDYKLMPLSLLEKSIKETGHLPGLPSAEVVSSEGIDLGDMQKNIVEKIEELTLYIIALEKKIAVLENK